MAVTQAEVGAEFNARGNKKIVDITFSADADTTATVAHGFGVTPEEITLTPLTSQASVGLPRASTIDATNVVVTKQTTAGSAGTVVRLIARKQSHQTR